MHITPGVPLDHDLMMRRDLNINTDMIRKIGMLMGRILLNKDMTTGHVITDLFKLLDLFIDHGFDL